MSPDQLTKELRELGRCLTSGPADPDTLSERVMSWLEPGRAEPKPVATAGSAVTVRRPRGRSALAVAASVLIVLALTPPVRAAVVDWFGVIVRPGPPAVEAPVPGVMPALTLEQAADMVGFDPVVPAELGPPDGVEVMSGGRVVSLSWSAPDGTVRVDQFEGLLAPAFVKHGEAEQIDIDGHTAVWFEGPHYLTVLDEHGLEYAGSARSAGPTLIWEHAGVTLRLEGTDRTNAVQIARNVLGTG